MNNKIINFWCKDRKKLTFRIPISDTSMQVSFLFCFMTAFFSSLFGIFAKSYDSMECLLHSIVEYLHHFLL